MTKEEWDARQEELRIKSPLDPNVKANLFRGELLEAAKEGLVQAVNKIK